MRLHRMVLTNYRGIAHREIDPYTAAADVLARALGSGGTR